ncbi:MAG: vanadium-dependent haloperoxidase [Planctomycetes bacterium]|nr:vanadium-dependent haloperoxidase [Planctomycetota bacterium]MBI3832944.1 vanadium-dependent haloperoxidase [Planctomycetota bacterium]
MKLSKRIHQFVCALGFATAFASPATTLAAQSAARQWNEELIAAIRIDLARPTVHARNLYHVSLAMWDAWAAYDDIADTVLAHEHATAGDIEAARAEAISYAAYGVLKERFAHSPGAATSLPKFDARMATLGYDKNFTSTVGDSPAAVGNRIAQAVIEFGLNDNSNEANSYANRHYIPVNPPLVVALPGDPNIIDPNRWQPLALNFFVDQGGNVILGGYPPALTPEWGQVTPFAMTPDDLNIYHNDSQSYDYWVYHDPGPPPLLGGIGNDYFKWGHEQVVIWSGHLDPTDGVMWDISPASRGNVPLPDPADYQSFYDQLGGGDTSPGYPENPVTHLPYAPQIVPRGDFARVLAEFWADGPTSETPPGHWFTLLNYVSDQPSTQKRFGGTGPVLNGLEWDVKGYLAMGGALHDVAVSVWGIKGWYDTSRPISAIRYMAGLGQCSDPNGPSYNSKGIHLYPGVIEVVTPESSAPGERHEGMDIGKIALHAWRGPNFIFNPSTDVAGVGWILADEWWPYQRPSFVTPPFPGYTSGHSAYSRAGAEVLTLLTGSPYFPGGLGEFHCTHNQYLVFEDGPSVDVTLQWASYYDAADQSALSRIWGGIHPGQDDLPSRQIGSVVGIDAFHHARTFFTGTAGDYPYGNDEADEDGDGVANGVDQCPHTIPNAEVDSSGCPPFVFCDADRDGDIDLRDIAGFQKCMGANTLSLPACDSFDANNNHSVGKPDLTLILPDFRGPNVPAAP